ncbi:hypothetical protein TVAG_256090 [Trichomonas vaginalis G3]|uniref:Uncharacterized protein n=1 Tax=Trichomonas vaginalis (strain ATCC PRA-98 / G3) TaxID=412133 RepID=A2FYA3_TRIV3|nr:coagulation factor 5/8 C-terminal domain-containing protein family [Trichomonas vaginalis G3]EAX90104.1 hypothetical protein TVAG_256090 [Trichomonas vaginalis G3]KAI5521665.1 coagulation factor 5/8 C-terminal domain-containing protein family [Trichomonas vaginalis G3]|eukprot:XP_001303034.1 hypothetical protein [Trichomonas vaginalis G3]
MLAYYMTEAPPFNIKGKDNIGIYLCPLGNDIGHPINESAHPETVYFKQIVANWTKIVKYVHLYEYHTNFWVPLHLTPNYWMVGRNIQYYASLGVYGYMAEDKMLWTRTPPTRLAQHTDFTYFRQYVMSKMMFYPNRPVLYYEDDFLYGFYGAGAAAYVRRFLNVTKEVADLHPEAYINCLGGEIQGFQTNNYNYYAYWLWGKAVEKAKETGSEKQIFNTMMAELPSANTIITMESRMKWPLVVDEEGKIRFKGSKIKECAIKILERCKDPYYVDNYTKGICSVTRDLNANAAKVYQNLAFWRDSNPAVIMKSGNLKAISGENPAYGRIFSFTKGNTEFVDNIEGIDFCMYDSFKITYHINYDMKTGTKTDKTAAFSFDSNDMKMEKTYTLNDNSLTMNCKFTNKKGSVFQSRPTFSINLDLGDSTDIFYKLGNGNWERPVIDEVATYVNHFGKQTGSQSTLSICSGKTKRGMKFDFSAQKISFFSVCLNKSSKFVKVYIGAEFVQVNSNAAYDSFLTLTTLESISNLPSTPMPNLETPGKIVHFYPLYYINVGFQNWQPTNDAMSFVGISASSLSGVPGKSSRLSFRVCQNLPEVFGLHGTWMNMTFRSRCTERNMSQQWPWWSGYTKQGKDNYQGSETWMVPKNDVYFYIPLREMKNATSDINVWLECTTVCKRFWSDGFKLEQRTDSSAYYGYPDTNFKFNDDLEPMKEPNMTEYMQNAGISIIETSSNETNTTETDEKSESNKKSKAGVIAGSIIGALVVIGVIVAVVFVIMVKRGEKSDSDKDVVMKEIMV